MSKDIVEVRMPYTALFGTIAPGNPLPIKPDIHLWDNHKFIDWATQAGFDGVEFHGLVVPTQKVLRTPVEVLTTWHKVRSGHVVFNPYANLMSILTGQEDPLRPGEKIAKYNLALASQNDASKALLRLSEAKNGQFPITTYHFIAGGLKPYGEYPQELIQTHPSVFDDSSDAEDFIDLVNQEMAYGVTWDCYHALESTRFGEKPFADWERSLSMMLEAGVVKEVHVQAGRVPHNDPRVPSLEWLQGMVGENPKYNNELGKMIRLIKDADPTIPFVTEITIDSFIKAGLITRPQVIANLRNIANLQRQTVDFIKRV